MYKIGSLFSGIGGFELGLERALPARTIWQVEQDKFCQSILKKHWPKAKIYSDVRNITKENVEPVHILCGGFPCQDYSVATTLKNSKGLKGKKGVLWWSIERIIREKKNKPKYLILENVDRLLKSPSNRRGRDFAVMLGCLNQLGYAVEWRVINAAEYGFPQRRRRVFIIAYHNSTKQFKNLKENPHDWLDVNGTNAKAFPIKEINLEDLKEFKLVEKKSSIITDKDIKSISNNFGFLDKVSRFQNSGICIGNKVLTYKSIPNYSGKYKKLGNIIEKGKVDDSFYIKKDKDKWEYLKGGKKEERITKDGFKYNYSEGGMIFPDNLDNASRTIITGEGGPSPSRFKHVIEINGKWRRLTPVELEKLNGFPKDHTKMDGITDTKRAFFMGNALVCGVVEKIGNNLI